MGRTTRRSREPPAGSPTRRPMRRGTAQSERRAHAAELLSIPLGAVDAALDYYVAHTEEVDAELAERARIADETEARWRRGQQLRAT